MRLGTVRITDGTRAVRFDEGRLVDLGLRDVRAVLEIPEWRALAASAGEVLDARSIVGYAPPVLEPRKIVCVGLNYREHIHEMGRDLPSHPTLFLKLAETLVGAGDEIESPPESAAMDWEAEMAVVLGSSVRRARGSQAEAAIAGFTVFNDVTMRDWQYRTAMWDQGKCWEGTSPLGPWVVTPDELPGGVRPDLRLSCEIDGIEVQDAATRNLIFDPVSLVEYVSTIVTLRPGDVIATGTPGGVGSARTPPQYLQPGNCMVTSIEGLGTMSNLVIAGSAASAS